MSQNIADGYIDRNSGDLLDGELGEARLRIIGRGLYGLILTMYLLKPALWDFYTFITWYCKQSNFKSICGLQGPVA